MMLSLSSRPLLLAIASRWGLRSCTTHSESNNTYDMVVNGGGIVGLSLLSALSASPYFADRRILLLEQQPKRHNDLIINENGGEDRMLSNRVTSLTAASKRFYQSVGVWDEDLDQMSKKCRSMYVWSADFEKGIMFSPLYPSPLDMLPQPFGCPYYDVKVKDDTVCLFVENDRLTRAIESRVPSNWIRNEASVTDLHAEGSDVVLTLAGEAGETIRTKLLIGCDGFQSLVRRKSTLDYFEYPLEQACIVGTVQMAGSDFSSGENDIVFQRFLDDRTVVGLLPISDTHCSFAISTTSSQANMMMQLEDQEFVDAMNTLLTMRESSADKRSPIKSVVRSVEEVLSKVLPAANRPPVSDVPSIQSLVPNSRSSYPLAFGTTVPAMVGSPKGSNNDKIVVIGDASHRIPPLAGQGLNLGIGDAIELAECLTQPLERGDDLFDNNESLVRALNRFERKRQFKIIPMLAAIASVKQAFHLTPPSILSQVNKLSAIKNEFVRFANSR